jgi:tetratricopeptide (TPR) repeat protein
MDRTGGLEADLRAFVKETDYPAAGRLLRRSPKLLGADAQRLLATYGAGHAAAAKLCAQHRRFLQRCAATPLDLVFPEGSPYIDPTMVGLVGEQLYEAEAAEQRYRQTGDPDAITAAAGARQRLLETEALESAHPSLLSALANDAGATMLSAYLAGAPVDLRYAESLLARAVALTPLWSVRWATRQSNLGNVRLEWAKQTGAPEDLDDALATLRSAARGARGVRAGVVAFRNLARGLDELYTARQLRPALEEAVARLETAMIASGNDPAVGGELGNALRRRWEVDGPDDDLDRAIDLLDQALGSGQYLPGQAAFLRNNLAVALLARHGRDGSEPDLRRALAALEDNEAVLDPRTPVYGGMLAQVAGGLLRRFEVVGVRDDLDRSVRLFRRAMEPPKPQPADVVDATIGYAAAAELRARYSNPDAARRDRDEVITLLDALQRRLSPTSSSYAIAVGNLGNALRARRSGPDDLERAVACLRTAVGALPPDAMDAPAFRINLGLTLREQAVAAADRAGLDKAVDLLESIRAEPHSADAARAEAALAVALAARHDLDPQPGDAERAGTLFATSSATALRIDPDTAVAIARSWADWAARNRWWPQAHRASAVAADALDQLVTLQSTLEARLGWLRQGPELAADGAYAALRAGDDRDAASRLEAGRVMSSRRAFESQAGALRRLSAVEPGLAERFRGATARVRALSTAPGSGW